MAYQDATVFSVMFNCRMNYNWSIIVSTLASRWKEAASGRHVDYDQKPDVFR